MKKFKVKVSSIAYVTRELIVSAKSRETAWKYVEDKILYSEGFDLLDLNWQLPEELSSPEVYEINEVKNGL